MIERDLAEYLNKFITPITVCRKYRPKFGQGGKEEGVSLGQFHDIYSADPFYAWCGLDSDLMYAAHKAAGGMTSIYRQIGKGCEHLFREIIIDSTGYSDRNSAMWSYESKTQGGKNKVLALDGRLKRDDIVNPAIRQNVDRWITEYCELIGAEEPKNGAVFEVRQGYKSKDSKRQNGDIDNVAVAWSQGYLPVFAIFSAQIDGDLVLRYRNNRAGIIVGRIDKSSLISLYTFTEQVLDFDLAAFFKGHSETIKAEVHATLEALLRAG